MKSPLWQPTQRQIRETQLSGFQALASEAAGRELSRYEDLHRWSVTHPGEFWQLVARFTDIRFQQPCTSAVEKLDEFPGARFFPGASLNFAENLLRFSDDKPALVSVLETGERRTLSYRDIRQQTACVARHLRDVGIVAGDRVAGWLPNVPETVVAMLATASLGAVWSSCSPDFGASGALDRFGQIEPRVLFACDGYFYNGKRLATVDKVREVSNAVPSIREIVWVDLLGASPTGETTFADLLRSRPVDLKFAQLDFNDPLYIMYSSGTTGKPKCIVHGAGGTLLQHVKEHRLHVDLTRNDVLFFFTTCGWMMWNWLVSGLATGCTLVLFEGSPFHPGAGVLWDMAEREKVTVFGVSAKYLSAVEKAGYKPRESHDLSAMRALLSTGSPLAHEGFQFVYRDVKPDVHLASISGGTDLISCFVLGNPNLPVWEGEIQSPGLGMAVEVWDATGKSVRGVKGELVCTTPFPSCPVGFWNDPGNDKFLDAYFRRYPNVWAHGDFAEITGHNGFIIHGRSDAVLNPGGVRIGTAEIYRQVERIEAVQEAICVGQEWEGDTRVVLFVVMAPGETLTAALTEEIRNNIRTHASPRHVPARIIEVADIPRTMSGKIVELAVRDAIHGRSVKNTSALANPEALDYFRDLEALT